MRNRIVIASILFFAALAASGLVITEDTTDFALLYSSGYYLSIDRHPGSLGTFAAPGWAILVNNEPVHVVAHGAQGTIGQNVMDGAGFAAWIDIPAWYTTMVYAESCESAVTLPATPSVIAAAADASRSSRSFTGYAGCAITDAPHGVERVVLPTKRAEMTGIQQRLEQQLNPQRVIDTFVQNYRQAHNGAGPPLLLLAQTAYNSQEIRGFFAALLREGELDGCFYPMGTGIVTKAGKLP